VGRRCRPCRRAYVGRPPKGLTGSAW
jgi:hypothetical protein